MESSVQESHEGKSGQFSLLWVGVGIFYSCGLELVAFTNMWPAVGIFTLIKARLSSFTRVCVGISSEY